MVVAKLKGIVKGLQGFKNSVKDLPASDFKYKSSKGSGDDFFKKFLERLDKDPALRERVKRGFNKGDKGLFTEKALKEYQSGKGDLFKKLNPTPEEVSDALGKKKPAKHKSGGVVKKKDGGWIQGAIKKPGALRQQLGVKEGEKIPAKKLNAAAKKGGKLGQRARLAKTLRGFNNGGVVTKWESKWG